MTIKYYCKKLRKEVSEPSDTTMDSTNEEISFIFEPLPEGKWLRYLDDGVPYLVDSISINEEALKQAEINAAALEYLSTTDWYLLRELDGGVAMTETMKQLRAEARLKIV